MKITWSKKQINRFETELIAIPYRAGGENAAFGALNKETRKDLAALAKAEKFKGEKDRTLVWQGKLGGRFVRIIALGMGKGKIEPSVWRRAVGKAVQYGTDHRLRSLAVFVDEPSAERQVDQVQWATEALLMATYRFTKYKSKTPSNPPPKEGIIGVHSKTVDEPKCRLAIKNAKAAIGGVILTRDLVNEPANALSPVELAERAQIMADQKGLECTVLDEQEIRRLGMNLLLSVAAGSDRAPRLVHLVYRPRGKPVASVALVGKGITFDSGGLCVKPGKSMYTMKTDMAGAGVVLGVMSALRTLAPRVIVHGIIPLTDNAISGNATRPGDVIKSLSGLTVEILNTDAEGRLILADALTYADKLKPDTIIDYATLTGACVVALGDHTAGLFSPSDDLAEQYLLAARQAGELIWRLPLSAELKRELKSEIADIKNIGNRSGGAITAALFLKHFVKKTSWIHLDIAGPARSEKNTPICPRGGSGFGVLTALQYLLEL
ncbi:MAG: leucyl aminopeptidase [Proteobacteria bacterium]|nr:leucyl aminopeptidase [Pseudomonadota bacterium]